MGIKTPKDILVPDSQVSLLSYCGSPISWCSPWEALDDGTIPPIWSQTSWLAKRAYHLSGQSMPKSGLVHSENIPEKIHSSATPSNRCCGNRIRNISRPALGRPLLPKAHFASRSPTLLRSDRSDKEVRTTKGAGFNLPATSVRAKIGLGGLYWPSSFLWKSDSATCRIGPRPPHKVVTIDREGKTRKNYKLDATPIDGPARSCCPRPRSVRCGCKCPAAEFRRSGRRNGLAMLPPAPPPTQPKCHCRRRRRHCASSSLMSPLRLSPRSAGGSLTEM
jgi:hypothetical protein